MPIDKTTRSPLVQPVSAIDATSPESNDLGRQSERMRPVHIATAQEEGLAGAHRLAQMAREPLPPHLVALYIAHNAPASTLAEKFGKPAKPAAVTYATISAEARALLEAEQSGNAVITHVGADPLGLYTEVAGLTTPTPPKRG